MNMGNMVRMGAQWLAFVIALSGCTPPTVPAAAPSDTVVRGSAMAVLDGLTVAADGPMTGYSRERFGQPWRDTDGNGCDQRSDVLVRDAGSAGRDERRPCKVVAISLPDPYTGQTLTTLADIEIDHVVSLGASWRAGAARWSDAERERFANDQANLLAVRDKVNQAKSDKPPERFQSLIRRDAWCKTATIYVSVSVAYRLSVTAASYAALTDMLTTCEVS